MLLNVEPPAPLDGSDRFRPTEVQRRLNRTISTYCAVFSYLKMTTQDRHRTEKRLNKTAIGCKSATQKTRDAKCSSCVAVSVVTMFCAALYETATLT